MAAVRLAAASRRYFSTSRRLDAKVAFIGLGNMGKHMANNLRKSGHELTVFDVNKEVVADFQKLGARAAANPKEAATGADAVVTMLPGNAHVQAVYGDASSGVFVGAKPGALLLDCSTIDPVVSKGVSKAAAANGFAFVDAPVSGGVGGAEAGTLTFMCGGEKGDFEAARPFLSAMGKNIVHVGPAGSGCIAKIVNNMILGVTMVGVSEAMNLGARLGADPKTLAAIINTSSGRCWSSDTYNPVPGVMPNVPSSRGYTGGFANALMTKDLGLSLEAGKSAGAPLPLTAAAHSTYSMMLSQGLGGLDFSSAYAFFGGALPTKSNA